MFNIVCLNNRHRSLLSIYIYIDSRCKVICNFKQRYDDFILRIV